MASRPSIVFLFDLDLPSGRSGSSLMNCDDDFPSQCTRLLRHIALNILNYFSEKQVNIQWGYRFYSSSNYQLTSKARFVDLTTQTVEEFEEALNVRFEQNNADGTDCLNQMTAAGVLSRTLQDIVSDYEWKTPSDSLTPTRKGKRAGGKQIDQSLQNLVFIFTEVPSDEALGSFCKFDVQDELSIKAVTDAILPKELAKRFQEFQLSLNFIDLSHDKKTTFSKIAANLRGAVISALALTSPFSFSQILQASCVTEEVSPEKCDSCKNSSLGSKVFVKVLNDHQPLELQVQCWNSNCTKSSLCLEDTNVSIPVIKCMAVQKTSVPSLNWLKHESLHLLSSKNPQLPNLLSQKISWIGQLDGRFCCISPLTSHTAFMVLPSSDCSSFQSWARNLFDTIHHKQEESQCSRVRTLVERLLLENDLGDSCGEHSTSPAPVRSSNLLNQLKGNYTEKKGTHLGLHWQMLKKCFQNEETEEKFLKEFNNNSFDQLSHPNDVSSIVQTGNDGTLKKIGSNRIQNLRASTLLQKSQEVRARNDEKEREKIHKEKQVAEEKKEKVWKELQNYLTSLRASIECGEGIIQLVPNNVNDFPKEEILERCLKLKKQGFTPQTEDWHLLCLVQVITSTILYIWKENMSMETGFGVIYENFMKKPSAVNRSTPKDSKIHEFKFQILLRLELSWIVPSLVGEEEDVLQDTTSLFQLLSIHSSPPVISSFFLDALVVSYENMLPEFLVNLGEELNQPIPASLSDQVKRSTRTPSPALSSKTLSVQSVASQHETLDSQQRSVARGLRSRTLTRQPSINILQHKKQITLPNKVERQPTAPAVKKQESNEVVRVRRSLQFGTESPLQKTRSKSPAKGSFTPRRLSSSFEPLLEFATPNKAPNAILAPETPSRLRSDAKNKKTDGVNIVGESPEGKHEALRRSPRRMEAASALLRRASFYSTLNSDVNPEKGSSRNWSRAESQVWSEKAKASASLVEDNSPQVGLSARFLFSKILSRNDSMPSSSNEPTMLVEPDQRTPRKANSAGLFPPSTPSRQRLVVAESDVLVQGTPQKTPMKTPRHVQFNFSFQPATPSSKTVPDPRSILKSPMTFQSPLQSRTPRKSAVKDQVDVVHILDDTNFKGRHQLELHSPVKKEEVELSVDGSNGHDNELIHKLDENTLRPDEEVELQSPSKDQAIVSPVILRRSPRHPLTYQNNQATNFYAHNPNWSVVNYRRLAVDGTRQPNPTSTSNDGAQDPYEFGEEAEVKPSRFNLPDSSSHKRKLFQTSTEKTPISKRRRIIPNTSPVQESKTPPCSKFQAPKEGSLFHLENSPLLNSIEAKFLV